MATRGLIFQTISRYHNSNNTMFYFSNQIFRHRFNLISFRCKEAMGRSTIDCDEAISLAIKAENDTSEKEMSDENMTHASRLLNNNNVNNHSNDQRQTEKTTNEISQSLSTNECDLDIMPPSYDQIFHRLNNEENVSISEMISFFNDCIKVKKHYWQICQSMVDFCWMLHLQFIANDENRINLQYCSKLTHIISNTFQNKSKFDKIFDILKEHSLINHVSFELLIKSCYNEDTGRRFRCIGDAYLARYIYQLFGQLNVKPSENIVREMLISCIKRGSFDVSLAMLNDFEQAGCRIKPSAFRIAFDTASKLWNTAMADQIITFMRRNGYKLNENILLSYLHVCRRCVNWDRALHCIELFEMNGIYPNVACINELMQCFILFAKCKKVVNFGIRSNANEKLLFDVNNKTNILSKIGHLWNNDIPLSNISKLLSSNHNTSLNVIELAYDKDENYNDQILHIFRKLAFFGSRFADPKCLMKIVKYIEKHHFIYRNSLKNHHRQLMIEHNLRLKRDNYNMSNIGSITRRLNPNYQTCLNLLGNPMIAADLIRGLSKHNESKMACQIWHHYTQNITNQKIDLFEHGMNKSTLSWFEFENNDANTVYPCSVMLEICGNLIFEAQYQEIGEDICDFLEKNNYFRNQKIYDSTIQFLSKFYDCPNLTNDDKQNIDIRLAKLKLHGKKIGNENGNGNRNGNGNEEIVKNGQIQASEDTMIGLLQLSLVNNDILELKHYIKHIYHLNIAMTPALVRAMLVCYGHFGSYKECLTVFRFGLKEKIIHQKRDIHYGMTNIFAAFINSGAYAECIEYFVSNIDFDFLNENENDNNSNKCDSYVMWTKMFFDSNNVTSLMYCCYQLNEIEFGLKLFEFILYFYGNNCKREKNENILQTWTYNWFVELLIKNFGEFNDETVKTIKQLISDGVWKLYNSIDGTNYMCLYNNVHNINISNLSASIVPVILYLHVMNIEDDIGNDYLTMQDQDSTFINFSIRCDIDTSNVNSMYGLNYNDKYMRNNSTNHRKYRKIKAMQRMKEKSIDMFETIDPKIHSNHYLLSIAQSFLMTRFCPPIECVMSDPFTLDCTLPKHKTIFLGNITTMT